MTFIALYWDGGSAVAIWAALFGKVTNSLATTLIVTNVMRSQLYQFKHRAANIFGAGVFSAATTIKAATKLD